jgi:hypothetical protein
MSPTQTAIHLLKQSPMVAVAVVHPEPLVCLVVPVVAVAQTTPLSRSPVEPLPETRW